MILFFLRSCLVIVFYSIFLTPVSAQVTPPDERPFLKLTEINIMNTQIKKADLCPKKESDHKYHHKLFLIDTTTQLKQTQIELIKRLLLSEEQLRRIHPYDRITIMKLRGVAPQANKPALSMCRPRSGDQNSPYKLDKHDWLVETERELNTHFKRLVDGVEGVFTNINNTEVSESDPSYVGGSPIMEQLKEISRIPDYKFDEYAGYQKRTLTIVSDLHQNTERIPFYDYCKIGRNNNCPSFEEFKKQKKIKRWIEKTIPDFGENIEVKFFYLNTLSDPNLDREVLEFWEDYFIEAGIDNFDYEIESDS